MRINKKLYSIFELYESDLNADVTQTVQTIVQLCVCDIWEPMGVIAR